MPDTVLEAGIDEAGRGALAGPVVAAAVCLNPHRPIAGLDDSKKLTPRRRELLADEIRRTARSWALGVASALEVDRFNVLRASLLAMRRACLNLSVAPDLALVDGNQLPLLPCAARAVVGGDGRFACIAAASVLAKVERDRLMRLSDRIWPDYDFALHKGYPTPHHLQRLRRFGVCSAHRRSYAPVRRALQPALL